MSKYQEAQQLMKKVWEHEYHNHKKPSEYVTNLTFQEILNMQARLQKIQTIREKMSDPTIYKQQYYKYMKSSTGRLSVSPYSETRPMLKSDSKILFDRQRQDNENKTLEKSMKITTSQVSQGPSNELPRTNTERSILNHISQMSIHERHPHHQENNRVSFMTFDKLFAEDERSKQNNLLSQCQQTKITEEFLKATEPGVPANDVASVMERRDKFLKPRQPKKQTDFGPVYITETPQSRTQSQNTLREEVMQERFVRNSCMVKHLRLASVQYIKQKRTNSATPLTNFVNSQLNGREVISKTQKRPPITQIEANLERLKKFGRGAPK